MLLQILWSAAAQFFAAPERARDTVSKCGAKFLVVHAILELAYNNICTELQKQGRPKLACVQTSHVSFAPRGVT